MDPSLAIALWVAIAVSITCLYVQKLVLYVAGHSNDRPVVSDAFVVGISWAFLFYWGQYWLRGAL